MTYQTTLCQFLGSWFDELVEATEGAGMANIMLKSAGQSVRGFLADLDAAPAAKQEPLIQRIIEAGQRLDAEAGNGPA